MMIDAFKYKSFVEFMLLLAYFGFCNSKTIVNRVPKSSISIGPCTWIIDRKCPDEDVKFYLFTRNNLQDRQFVYIDETREKSNLSESFFNPLNPTKIIIHGYNSDMFLHPLIQMKDEYLQIRDYNLFYVDWSTLSTGPCYFSAVHNTRHTGDCIAQLIERILEEGSANIHLIGFSLGAHVPNYVALSLGSFILPRITGLDPALPLFITASIDNKLDPTDAAFVDVIHTNALVQGKIERCGHADFYINGGIVQPGCMGVNENPFACSHHRAADYFTESIRSYKGFWGWACSSYINYLLGLCPQTNYLVLAGENCNYNTEGMFLITTNDQSPFAKGKWTENIIKTAQNGPHLDSPYERYNPLSQAVNQWGKLDSSFNNIQHFPTPVPQDLIGNNWPYFNIDSTDEITKILKQKEPFETNIMESTNENKRNKIVDKLKESTSTKVESKHKATNYYKYNTNEVDEIKARQKFLQSYKQNLTFGLINNNVFELPKLQDH